MSNTNPACFLVLEGPDGSGKTTQLELLRQHLVAKGQEVMVVREPGGTVVGEGIRDLFKANFGHTDPMTEVLMLLAARQQLTVEVIQPALERGVWVISDRHTPSMFAYQGAGHQLGYDTLIELRKGLGRHNRNADATVILQITPEERQRRLQLRQQTGRLDETSEGRQIDRLDEADEEFIQRVAGAYDEMINGNWELGLGRVYGVDAVGHHEDVHDRILEALFREVGGLE